MIDYTKHNDIININGIVDVSSVKEWKTFTVSSTTVERPSITKDFIRFQSKTYLGESSIISGFKMDSDAKTSKSVPLVSDIPLIGWIFGYDKKTKDKIEYLVIITPLGT